MALEAKIVATTRKIERLSLIRISLVICFISDLSIPAFGTTWVCAVEEYGGSSSTPEVWKVETDIDPNPCPHPLKCIYVTNPLTIDCPDGQPDISGDCKPATQTWLLTFQANGNLWATKPSVASTEYLVLTEKNKTLNYTTIMPGFPSLSALQPLRFGENCVVTE